MGAVAAALVVFVTSGPVAVPADSILWRHFAGGARLRQPAAVLLPALRRLEGGRLAVAARAEIPAERPLAVSIDGRAPSALVLAAGKRAWLALPPRAEDGAEVRLHPSAPVVLDGLVVAARPEWERAVAAFLAVGLMTFALARRLPLPAAAGLGLFAAGGIGLGSVPGWTLLAWPGTGTAVRLAAPLLAAAAGLVSLLRHARARAVLRLAALIAALLFGCWVRAFLLPSAGSWDVDYWRTAMLQAARHGFDHAYGGPDDVPPGHFLAQLTGREPVSRPDLVGRPIVVNYPPLAVWLWTASWQVLGVRAARLDAFEREALATKLPSLAGDIAAVALLVWMHRARPWRGAALAALFWATPVSWLNSAAQGYQDGAYAPLILLALVLASGGRGFAAGATLGLAAMIKLPALLVAPVVAAALVASATQMGEGSRPRAAGRVASAAAGGLAAIVLAFLPFARAGTLAAAVVHVNSIWLPGPASGGSPNLWWLAGHASAVASGSAEALGRVPFVHSTALPVPAYAIGRLLWLSAAAFVFLLVRRHAGERSAVLGGATLFFAYAMLATGVFENHIHPMFLLLLAGGLVTRRCRLVTAAAAAVYVLDVLALSGMGRFYSARHLTLQWLSAHFDTLRLGPGFDTTLVLAVVNLVLFALWCAALPRLLRARLPEADPAYPPLGPLA